MSEFSLLPAVTIPLVYESPVQDNWLMPLNFTHASDDTITRKVSFSSPSVVVNTTWQTSHITSQLSAWHSNLQADVAALKIVVRFQRKYINYQATYNAFLLGTLTEDEFDEESNAYISEERTVDPGELADTIERLDRLLEFELNDRELGEYLEVDHDSIERALASMENRKINGGREGGETSLLPDWL